MNRNLNKLIEDTCCNFCAVLGDSKGDRLWKNQVVVVLSDETLEKGADEDPAAVTVSLLRVRWLLARPLDAFQVRLGAREASPVSVDVVPDADVHTLRCQRVEEKKVASLYVCEKESPMQMCLK